MPGLFAFAFSAETRLNRRMEEMANEAEHKMSVARWADAKHKEELQQQQQSNVSVGLSDADRRLETEVRLTELYRQSVEQSGVRIIKGDQLGLHHKIANYWQANPFKILAIVGVPAVGYIFYGRSGQQHLQTSLKIMHTRVMGQFSIIGILLGLMGFKEYMDRNGRFITEAEADAQVQEMHQVREELQMRLDHEKNIRKQIQLQQEEAHARDMAAGQTDTEGKKKRKKKALKKKKAVEALEASVVVDDGAEGGDAASSDKE